MPNYIQDPNDSKKQIPGPPSDKMYDRSSTPSANTLIKTPNYVIVKNITGTTDLGFFFGSSASFASMSAANTATGAGTSSNYTSYGAPTAGTQLHIHPTAWSGSAASSVLFIYKGGLDGTGRP